MGRKPKLSVVDGENVDTSAAPEASTVDDRKNSDLTDDEKQALLLQGVAEIERNQAKKAEAVNPLDAAIKLARKRLKAEGFPKSEVDEALRQRKMEPEDVISHVQMTFRVARWTGKAPGYQPDLFADGVDRTPLIDRARNDGRTAGMSGDDCKCPEKYSEASDAGQAWIAGWHDGQGVLLSALAKRKPAEADEAEEGGGLPDAEGEASYEYIN